jgi:hypothetical protein
VHSVLLSQPKRMLTPHALSDLSSHSNIFIRMVQILAMQQRRK